MLRKRFGGVPGSQGEGTKDGKWSRDKSVEECGRVTEAAAAAAAATAAAAARIRSGRQSMTETRQRNARGARWRL